MADRPPAIPVRGVHHGAFRCLDAEQTRWFYQDVLGLKLAGGVILEVVPGLERDDPYVHIFFEMANGEYIAFFDAPGSAPDDYAQRKESFDLHWAFELGSEEELLAMQARVRSFGIKCAGPVDHHFVRSVYMYDPNGIQVEFTYRTPRHDAIFAEEAAHFATDLAGWTERTRAMKVAKFGEDVIDRRAAMPGVA